MTFSNLHRDVCVFVILAEVKIVGQKSFYNDISLILKLAQDISFKVVKSSVHFLLSIDENSK